MTQATGMGGQMTFDGHHVVITRDRSSPLGRGEKRFYVSQISAVRWKPPGFMSGGFIQLTIPGSSERQPSKGSSTMAALKDENSVVFIKKQQPAFEELRSVLDAAIAARHTSRSTAGTPSGADELLKLAALRDQGVISPHDFETAKLRLLGI
ncbi:DUF4429 domain-containing protein [Streptomyces sp. NBC_00513]|uniref:DUF4429 domain-containing protein n=1 Tax=unclassified Streptomyces TaxID=2593676 RepID=UPI002255F02D|nr:DUF4429 domain-containing protein [Streptomyces sp. NBC_00424]MCX5078631.1 DUF4429 domain-containing protein [Streptomyces sp. NBC_00424]WUD39076.1 DUF4429 domain-containing protein [Streptomyces sp. NBC_00513]WUD45653.1 DUF4429 domain-containing protein [Streptomyces sp. NBC_00513]